MNANIQGSNIKCERSFFMDYIDKAMWVHTLWDPLNEMHQSSLHSNREGIRVAAYCRVSKGDTNFNSLENQISFYSNYIYSKPNWKFVGVYFDNKKSGGTVDHRPGFKRMLRHAKEGKIDLILTKNISRFSRNTKEILEILQQFKDSGTSVFFERERVEASNGLSSLALETYAAMAQDFLEGVSNSVKFSYRKRIIDGRPCFTEMYGYEVVENSKKSMMTVNEQESEVVRWIFSEFLKGYSYAEITRRLIENGIRTKKGNEKWNSTQVRKIILDITYTGNRQTMKVTRDLFTGKNITDNPLIDQYLIKDSHPAIISMEIFEKAQARTKEIQVKTKKHTGHSHNPLRNRIFCGRCMGSISIKSENSYECVNSNPSVLLCDLKRLKNVSLLEMSLNALIVRFMGAGVNYFKVDKNKDYDSDASSSANRSNQSDDYFRMQNELEKVLKKINQNDNFEFYRLKFFTEIEIAQIQHDSEEANQLLKEYKDFEEKAGVIEEDRKYRDEALLWLKTRHNIKQFMESATIEILRAWMTKITVYSYSSYIVEWIDEKITVIGEDEIPVITKAAMTKREERLQRISNQNQSIIDTLKVDDITIKSDEDE
jgi:DNA invertase Pin-like site-specific DNA recombinase